MVWMNSPLFSQPASGSRDSPDVLDENERGNGSGGDIRRHRYFSTLSGQYGQYVASIDILPTLLDQRQ
jgi:hypothetical protein